MNLWRGAGLSTTSDDRCRYCTDARDAPSLTKWLIWNESERRHQVIPILPAGGRVVANVVGLESYGKLSGIEPVDGPDQIAAGR